MAHCSRFSGGMPEERSAVNRVSKMRGSRAVCMSRARGAPDACSALNRGVIAQPRIAIGCLILEASAGVGRLKALGEAGRLKALGEERSETDCQRSMLLSSLARLWVSVASLSRMILVNLEAEMRILWGVSMLGWVSCVGARGCACFYIGFLDFRIFAREGSGARFLFFVFL